MYKKYSDIPPEKKQELKEKIKIGINPDFFQDQNDKEKVMA